MPSQRAVLRRGFEQPAFGLSDISSDSPSRLVEQGNRALGVGISSECMRHGILQHELVVTTFDGFRDFILVVIRRYHAMSISFR
jgi:hypothetical protein